MIESRAAVLIIEDDEPTQLLLRAIASRRGFDVTLAGDGESGLELLLSRDFDLVLLDLCLPLRHGREVLREVAAKRPHLLERIVVVTAAHLGVYGPESDLYRVCAIVRKPFDIDVLEHVLLECAGHPEGDDTPAVPSHERDANVTQFRRIH